ncbi:hypothetical protein HX021_10570 [Sphingobacterium sp. N143]|uniref:hypothetical protein n=1 Tax=Sphingobacterium sp. N143 TaxID=2746727 RepID=UPI0025751BF9|nr:hypothetical protein [Sphingobacterium sp. N143]MDM1294730.1 hypothetical protein [Sphingobacterium sp. N143]
MMFNKKSIWITLFFSIFSIALGFAQDRNRFQAIENEKIAYITKELNLTPKEAQQFFPLYNEYSQTLWNLRKAKLNGAPKNSFRGGSRSRDVLQYDAKEVDVKKEYRGKFARVIGSSRASQFFEVEQEFREHLYKSLRNRGR